MKGWEDRPLTNNFGDLLKKAKLVNKTPYEMGYEAHKEGKPLESNPFLSDSSANNERRIQWNKGFNSGVGRR